MHPQRLDCRHGRPHSPGFIDELVARADIVELIGARVPLKKAGREFKACCPFHDEKTPSFWVSPDKQFYHCFGCGAHGTALGFLMQYDQLPFPKRWRNWRGRLGLEVPREGGPARAKGPGTRRSRTLLGRVAGFYAETARATMNARASYLRGRGLEPRDSASASASAMRRTPGTRCCGASAPPTSRARALLATGLIVARETTARRAASLGTTASATA